MEENKQELSVKITEKQIVVPLETIKEQYYLPQSNLDMLYVPLYVSVFFCYKKPTSANTSFSSMVCVLKTSLSKALVTYYPFAGEMVKNAAGERMVYCNNRGVDFTVAFANIGLHELDLYKPDETFHGKLLPTVKQGLLAVQATELKCGAIVVGCTFNHQVADAHSANLFFVSWSEMARLGLLSYEPSFSRSWLNPRSPLQFDPSISDFYGPFPTSPEPNNNPASRIYYLSAHDISQLQRLSNENNSNTTTKPRTKYEAFSAFLWQTIAKGTNSNKNNSCRLSIAVDGRNVLHDSSSLLTSTYYYFGNVVSLPFCKAKIDQLQNMPLSWVANELHKLIQQTRTSEHFLGLIDYVESFSPEPTVMKIAVDKATPEEPSFLVSSGQQFPVKKVDFGWGSPAFGSYYFPCGIQGQQCGYVMPMPSATGNGDWVIFMELLKPQLDAIETYASHVLKPMKIEYMN